MRGVSAHTRSGDPWEKGWGVGRLLRTAAVSALAIGTTLTGFATTNAGASQSVAAKPTVPVVTPAQANDILTRVNGIVAQANTMLSAKLLATAETGPALAADTQFYAANKKLGVPFPNLQVTDSTIYVSRQTNWPAYFVAVEDLTDSQGNSLSEASLLRQPSKGAPWKVAVYANASGASADITLDNAGYATAATAKDAVVAPLKTSQALCAHYRSPGSSSDLFVSRDDGGISDLAVQVIAPAQVAAKAKGHKFVVQCVPQPATIAAFQSDSGAFVVFSTQLVTTETGTKTNPVVVGPAPSGQVNNIPVGKYLAVRHTHIAMLAGDVQSASGGTTTTPIDATFGEVFAGPASGTSPVK
jgi:hypothetical protein